MAEIERYVKCVFQEKMLAFLLEARRMLEYLEAEIDEEMVNAEESGEPDMLVVELHVKQGEGRDKLEEVIAADDYEWEAMQETVTDIWFELKFKLDYLITRVA